MHSNRNQRGRVRRPRKLTKPQRQRAHRVARRAVEGAQAAIGSRLVEVSLAAVGGEAERFYTATRLRDRDLEYHVWVWVTRRPRKEAADGR